MHRRPTIRIQLLALALAAMAPVAGAVVYFIIDASRTRLTQAESEIRNLAATTANNTAVAIVESEQLLSAVAKRPLVRALDPKRCDSVLAGFLTLHPEYANLGARDIHGRSVCSFLPNVAPSDVAVNFPWFKEGIGATGFTVGDAFRGSASGRWVSVLTYPLLDDRDRVIGVLGLPLDLLRLQYRVLPAVPKGGVVAVVDRQGRFLIRFPEPEQWIGKSLNDPEAVSRARRRSEGTIRLPNVDSVPRVFAFRTVAGTDWLAFVGIPEDALFAPVRRQLAAAAAIVLATLLLALVLVRRISAAIANPIRDLEATTGRVSAGDVEARAAIEGPAELANVAREFNRMLDVRNAAEAALHDSELRFRSVVSAMAEGVVLQDAEGRIVACNRGAERILGLTADQMTEVTSVDPRWRAIHEDGSPFPGDTHPAMVTLRTGAPQFDVTMGVHKPDGVLTWISINTQVITADGAPRAVVSSFRDITERKLAEVRINNLNRIYAVLSRINALIVRVRDREELFREACSIAVEAGQFRMAWIGLVDRDAMLVRPAAWSGEVRDFFDIAPLAVTETRPGGHGLAGQAVRRRTPVISNDIENDPQRMMKKEMRERGIKSLAVIPLLLDGEAVGVLALYARETGFFDDEEMKLLMELAGDISFALDHIAKAEKLDYVAYYDVLTGVANRTLFDDRLTQRLKDAAPEHLGVALVLLDIDRFKSVNDSLGRQAGDELLKQVARRLVRRAGDSSLVGRLNTNHFTIMLPGMKHADDAGRLVEEQLRDCFREPFQLGSGTELRMSAKAGVALYPGDGADPETLHRNAEAAMKQAKASGERFLFYAQQMTERIAEKLILENQLRRALEREEFVLHYQPKVNLKTRRVEGVEALIRWQSPERGLVPPMKFIPVLEETGMILEAGAWVIRRAALDHRHWVERGIVAPRISVNVSAIQLRKGDFVRTVQDALAQGTDRPGIDLEITESLVMEDIEENIKKLVAIRERGVSIAVDDFGTGYSSLRYLARLPAQTVKIDRSFIATILQDGNTMTLVSTIISLAHALGLKVVAEGVESEDQAKALLGLKCDEMQGYFISRPVPREELLAFLRSAS